MGLVEWSALGGAITIAIAIGGVVIRLLDRINKADSSAQGADARASVAEAKAAAATARVISLETQLVEHRVTTARDYVSRDMLQTFESRVVSAIDNLAKRFDQFIAKD